MHERCMEGAQKVHRRCMEGVREVHRRCNANDLIGCGGDPYPIRFILGAQKVCGRCAGGAQKLCRRFAEGAMPMIWLAVVGTISQ